MPSVTLEVGALVIVLVEWDAQLVVVEVDRPVEVLDLEEDLFDTDEPHDPLLHCRPPSPREHRASCFRANPTYAPAVSACSSQNRMSISRCIVVAVVRCSCACARLPVRR